MRKIYCCVVVLMLFLAGCGVSKQVHQAALDDVKSKEAQIEGLKLELEKTREEIEKLKKELEEATTAKDEETESLKKELEMLSNKADETSGEIDRAKDYETLAAKMDELFKEKEFLAREVERLKKYEDEEHEINKEIDAVYDTISKKLEKDIEKGLLSISKGKGRVSVSFSHFASGNAYVNKRGKQVLKSIGNALKDLSKMDVRVEGHTDGLPIGPRIRKTYPSNWELSTARATNVVKYLREKAGIDPKYLTASGLAKYRPVSGNDTMKDRARNRRVEIVLIPL